MGLVLSYINWSILTYHINNYLLFHQKPFYMDTIPIKTRDYFSIYLINRIPYLNSNICHLSFFDIVAILLFNGNR